jgi:hypothetical protein
MDASAEVHSHSDIHAHDIDVDLERGESPRHTDAEVDAPVGESSRLLGEGPSNSQEIEATPGDGSATSGNIGAEIDIDAATDTLSIESSDRGRIRPRNAAEGGSTSILRSLWHRLVSGRSAAEDAETEAEQATRGENDSAGLDPVDRAGTRASNGGSIDLSGNPVCLICLDPLSSSDFESGTAMSLDCGCRGDLALRHKECAIRWSQVNDDGRGGLPTCELCKKPVRNLPELPRRDVESSTEQANIMTIQEAYMADPAQFEQFVPSRADIMFDCVRVTWIAMIISILFFNASMGIALWTGMVSGLAYIVMLRLLYKHHFEALRVYAEAQHAMSARDQHHRASGGLPGLVISRV